MENTSAVVSQAVIAIRDISFSSEEERKEATKRAVEEQVKQLVQASFTGSLATSQLFEHFASIGGIENALEHYVMFCYSSAGWLKKSEVGTGKSEKLSGWKALRRYAAKLLLIETNQTWSDEMSDTAITTAVRAIWSQSTNDRAKRFFVNATVYNNLASYKSSYLTKKAADKSPDTDKLAAEKAAAEAAEKAAAEAAEKAAAEAAMQDIRQEARHTVKSMLAEVQREIVAVQSDPKATKQDLVDLMDYVSQMVAMLLE